MTYIIDRAFVPRKLAQFLSEADKMNIPILISIEYKEKGVIKENHRLYNEFSTILNTDGAIDFYIKSDGEPDPSFTIDPRIHPDTKKADELINAFHAIRGLGMTNYAFVITRSGNLFINHPKLLSVWDDITVTR